MLKLNNIYKKFPGCFDNVLKNINLELNQGDFCILIGSNGSGKSTLMKCISGEYEIDTGEIIIDKKAIIASVSQDIYKGTISEMTLLENMVLSRLLKKKASFSFYRQQIEEIKIIVKELGIGLENYIESPLKFLSGGQRQMIATLMAVTSKPQILLLDEHTSALDPSAQKLLMQYTSEAITKNKITSLMITHKLDDALLYGNRLIMLHQGEIVFDIKGKDKQELTINQLLDLFHQYEDLILKRTASCMS